MGEDRSQQPSGHEKDETMQSDVKDGLFLVGCVR